MARQAHRHGLTTLPWNRRPHPHKRNYLRWNLFFYQIVTQHLGLLLTFDDFQGYACSPFNIFHDFPAILSITHG